MQTRHFSTVLLLLLQNRALGQNLEFYVDVYGSDSWDGTSESNVDGSDVGPWRTLNHAVEEVRRLRPSSPPLPPTSDSRVTVFMLPGVYFLPATIALDERDSFLEIKSLYEDETVAISGGMALNGEWAEEDGGIVTTTFEGSCGEAFVGNQRLIPARSPNLEEITPNMILARSPYHFIKDLLLETETCTRDSTRYSQSCPEEDKMGFVFNDEFSSDWPHLEQTRVIVFHSWIAEYANIGNITVENGQSKVFFKEPLQHVPIGTYVPSSGWRFLIFNNLALLDMPGEYVCVDLGDGQSQFSYIPLESQDENTPVVVSQLKNLFDMNGVSDVRLEGLKLEHSSSGGEDGYRGGGESAVRMRSSDNVVVSDCHFTMTGMIGLHAQGCKNVHVTRSVFTDTGYHGVVFSYSDDGDGDFENDQRDVTVDNNMFDGCAMSSFWSPGCIWVGGYDNMTVRNNDFTNAPFTPVNVKGYMPRGGSYWEDNGVVEPTREDYVYHVEFNHIYQYGQGILNDMGAVHAGPSGAACDMDDEEYERECYVYSHIYNNKIHAARPYDNGGNFLYSDSSSARNTFENNVMFGTGDLALYHHCGKGNRGVNNIVHKTSSLSKMYGGCTKGATSPQQYENSRNIYLIDYMDEDFIFGGTFDRYYDRAPDFHHNLYWSLTPGDEELNKFPDDLNWYEWQASGNDSGSVWQDPLFEDPSTHQYILSEDSPAWDLGIEQVDLDNIGVQVYGKYVKNATKVGPPS